MTKAGMERPAEIGSRRGDGGGEQRRKTRTAGMEQDGGGNRSYGKNVGLFNYLIQLFNLLSSVYLAKNRPGHVLQLASEKLEASRMELTRLFCGVLVAHHRTDERVPSSS